MSERIVEIAHPARLSIRDSQLIIERAEYLPFCTPVSGIQTLLLAHPQITLTEAVISRLAEEGAMLVTIDSRYLPVSMMLPLQMHALQSERLSAQINFSVVRRKRVWQQIVREKIRAQGALLMELHGEDGGLSALARQVRSGDGSNLEARAARRYWGLLFGAAEAGNPRFRRGADPLESGPDQNRHLDYGYTVLRAAVARAICAAGLHPSVGLHHHNRYDPFCLAADLMEPFRPLVDRRVAQWLRNHEPSAPFDAAAKQWLIATVTARYRVKGEERALPDILLRAANSLAAVILGDRKQLELSEGLQPCLEDPTSAPTGVCG